MKTKPRVRAVCESSIGLVRENNEDRFLADGNHLVYCVADGMGGGEQGEKASGLVCAEIAMLLRQQPEDFRARMEAICTAVVCANEAILDYARAMAFSQMGTTLSLLVFDPAVRSRAAVCHVGDSRVYRFRGGAVMPLTSDHTVAAEISRRRGAGVTPDRANPLAHILTRAIGVTAAVCPDWRLVSVEPRDRFLICSDGVHDVIADDRLSELVSGGTPDEAKGRLVREVLAFGAPDNFTFIILDVADV